jgi:hypothetical protein
VPDSIEQRREKLRLRVREYRKKNREKLRDQRQEQYDQMLRDGGPALDKIKEARRAYYQRNRDKIRAKARAHPELQTIMHRKRKYGLTPEALAAMIDSQGGKCAICTTDLTALPQRNIHVDHCHKTGRLRNVLCGKCNTGLGMLRDDPVLLRRAADYIEYHRILA